MKTVIKVSLASVVVMIGLAIVLSAQQAVRVTNGASTAADNSTNSTTKAPVINCVANASAPSWTETNQVPCSVNLTGDTRVIAKIASAQTIAVTNAGTFLTQAAQSGSWVLSAGSALIGEIATIATATTTDAALTHYITSAASTNSTSVKGSAGNVYLLRAVNTTATLYYLRMYNLASAPTCSSATGFVESIPIPASTSGAGIVSPQMVPQGYTTGIAYCLTGGGSSSDNTSAATGVYLTLLYK